MTCNSCRFNEWDSRTQHNICILRKQGFPNIGTECPNYERYPGAENDYLEQPETD